MIWIWLIGLLLVWVVGFWPRTVLNVLVMCFVVPVGFVIYLFRESLRFARGLERYLDENN